MNNNIGGFGKINPLTFMGSTFCPHCGDRKDGKEPKRKQTKIGGDTMEKLETVQKIKKLNDVYRTGERGPGGAFHTYTIARRPGDTSPEGQNPTNPIIAVVRFQKGPRNAPDALTGVLDADLIEIVRDRLKCFQEGEYATKENARAIGYLEAALEAMNERVEERAKRGVLGTDKK